MPAKAKVTKEMIVDAAFAIAREAGVENINARTVSERLHCSTQPVMYHFATIEELKRTVYAKADCYHSEYLMNLKSPQKGVMLGIGMNYIRFAIEEPHLFRFLFQSDYFSGKTLLELINADELTPVISAMQNKLNMNREQTKKVFLTVFLFAHGHCKSPVPVRRFLFYVPLLILASGNLWNGVAINYTAAETACRIVCMLCVGILEEVIFRGLLFTAIAKNNVKSAIIISSLTFGIGHIINLFNGSGMDLVSNLCQIVFAIAIGFLLVTIFYRGGSLLPCILVHSAINTLSTFANDVNLTTEMHLIHLGILIVITVAYTLILTKTLPKNDGDLQISSNLQ